MSIEYAGMKICRFDDNRLGLVGDDGIRDVTAVLGRLPQATYPFPREDALIARLAELRPHIESAARMASPVPVERVKLLSPVANPGKIIAAPVNYKKHLEEALADKGIHHGNLVQEIHKAGMFLKATSSLVGAGEGVRLVHTDRRNDHEVELALVIGKRCRNVKAADALECVAGYCIGLDMTIRGPEERSLRKSPDSYCVLGPWLVTRDEVPDAGNLAVKIAVNGAVKQDAHTSDLILSVSQLIEWGSAFYTLHPGDVILTGTPQGVGPVRPGDVMLATIERIGEMRVEVGEMKRPPG
jgi:2-keto-4-pentenoate hydratase/2-oxohepta-3-ene-1,7-dioic acid hydratase in catechol pathway